tara:strand:- start:22 stop:366 length:345 start_codon:yes stop_codon:yes gene_type:complete
MTTKKKTTKKSTKKSSGKSYQIQAADLARFLELKSFDSSQCAEYVSAALKEADKFLGEKVSATDYGHLYAQGVLHLAAKFYATGESKVEKPQDIPLVCRHFFELARRGLSSTEG